LAGGLVGKPWRAVEDQGDLAHAEIAVGLIEPVCGPRARAGQRHRGRGVPAFAPSVPAPRPLISSGLQDWPPFRTERGGRARAPACGPTGSACATAAGQGAATDERVGL
jgi:hypothetical protein